MCQSDNTCKCTSELPGDSSLTPMCCKDEFDLVERRLINEAILVEWCPKCNTYVKAVKVQTHMPGIIAQTCTGCNTHYHANLLEEDDDEIRVPKGSVFPSLEELMNKNAERHRREAKEFNKIMKQM